MQTGILDVVRRDSLLSFYLHVNVHADGSRHGWFVRALVCEEQWNKEPHCQTGLMMHQETGVDRKKKSINKACDSPRLYHTSISPLSVRTSMMVWPKKSSDSRLNFCFTRDLMSSSSSHTRTLMRSEELWHSLKGRSNASQPQLLNTLPELLWQLICFSKLKTNKNYTNRVGIKYFQLPFTELDNSYPRINFTMVIGCLLHTKAFLMDAFKQRRIVSGYKMIPALWQQCANNVSWAVMF